MGKRETPPLGRRRTGDTIPGDVLDYKGKENFLHYARENQKGKNNSLY